MPYNQDVKTLYDVVSECIFLVRWFSSVLLRASRLFIAIILYSSFVLSSTKSAIEDTSYFFDDSMLVGSVKDQTIISRLNQADSITAGVYQVDIYVNSNFFSRQSLTFAENTNGTVSPCLSSELLLKAGIARESIIPVNTAKRCQTLDSQVKGATSRFDFARLRLDLLVPQALMVRVARGNISTDDLSAGETVAFTNYDTNYYRTDTSGRSSESTYVGLNSGLNLGLWQLRHQANYNRYSSDASLSNSHWTPLRTYLQRPVMALKSELTLGDSYTSGNMFSSIGFRGVQLETDDRMLPESQRGYAPTIHGIASTTANVSVLQSGNKIYQTTVAPGAFVIDDLYPTSSQGDLVVEIREADGRVSSWTVPFSAVPDSMRPGRSHISFSAGQVRNIGNSGAYFADLTSSIGLTNTITTNSGVRISEDYQSLLGGVVFASHLGALGLNAVYSRADIPGNTTSGWRLGATYSHTFTPISTTIALAGYRYATSGYRDLSDVLGVRDAHKHHNNWSSDTYQQKNQLVITLSQGLYSYGQLYVSGSTSDYRNGRGRDTQYQAGYSGNWHSISYNLSLGKQRTGGTSYGVQSLQDIGISRNYSGTQNIMMFSLSVPLGEGSRSPVLTTGVNHMTGNSSNTSYQTSLAGTLGDNQNISYTLNGTYENTGHGGAVGANITKQLPWSTISGSLSHSRDYTQAGAGLRGAVVVHPGGVTTGPYLGDTFGLVEADGVDGAEVQNGMGAQIDGSGYAIIPSLIPYSYNDISLDAKNIKNQNAELAENQLRIAPYAGAAVKVRFRTLEGYPLLIKISGKADRRPPLGADVYDNKNTIIGLVGQGNQVYARALAQKGTLLVKWGELPSAQCRINYDLSNTGLSQSLYRLRLPCDGI
ncbi:outer membrane usher protein [Trabulsiella guamensis ATCC 49490]|uniref:Outer membrane usher protein n=1 Tax=Trabulsiella guamensis ATCC 49490 TaxID=1005994 RepID=A0A085A818_9ENTR|nr:fimbria/pilus outer membrane usher protein [Trabulsiella guamensis]KFC06363.1 outer membrane usher protein [Trabulsiella guamensis ATCC 49490]